MRSTTQRMSEIDFDNIEDRILMKKREIVRRDLSENTCALSDEYSGSESDTEPADRLASIPVGQFFFEDKEDVVSEPQPSKEVESIMKQFDVIDNPDPKPRYSTTRNQPRMPYYFDDEDQDMDWWDIQQNTLHNSSSEMSECSEYSDGGDGGEGGEGGEPFKPWWTPTPPPEKKIFPGRGYRLSSNIDNKMIFHQVKDTQDVVRDLETMVSETYDMVKNNEDRIMLLEEKIDEIHNMLLRLTEEQ